MKRVLIYLAAIIMTLSSCSGEENKPNTSKPDSLPNSSATESSEDTASRPVVNGTDVFDFIISDNESRASLADAVEAVSNSAVCINVTGRAANYYYSYATETNASGVIISADGYILTANHVVEGGNAFSVTLNNGEEHTASLVAGDRKLDIAVLKIEAMDLNPIKLADSSGLRVGDFIFTVGNAAGHYGAGAAFGFVSALNTPVSYYGEERSLIQINACLNNSNAGGGIFDSNGDLVGIVSANASGDNAMGIAFAIPSADIVTAAEDLINHGYVKGRPCVGFEAVEINDMATAAMYGLTRLGLYVNKVEEGSGAAECGLQFKDYINAVDGETVISLERLNEIIKSKNIGDSIIFEIIRGDSTIDMVLVIEEERN